MSNEKETPSIRQRNLQHRSTGEGEGCHLRLSVLQLSQQLGMFQEHSTGRPLFLCHHRKPPIQNLSSGTPSPHLYPQQLRNCGKDLVWRGSPAQSPRPLPLSPGNCLGATEMHQFRADLLRSPLFPSLLDVTYLAMWHGTTC